MKKHEKDLQARKKSERDLQAQRREQENEILHRVLFWLGAAVLLEIIVLFVNRYYFHFRTLDSEISFAVSLEKAFPLIAVGGFVLGAACIVWAIFDKKRGKTLRVFRFILAGFFIALSVIAILCMKIGAPCIPVLLVGIPAFAGLVMVYYLYQREFFIVALCCGLGIFGTWLTRRAGEPQAALLYGYIIFAVCAIAAICLLSRYLKNNKGAWVSSGGKRVELLSPDANYLTIFLTGLFIALALIGALLLGATFAYYALLTLVVWFFVMAVYFTSKLM